ncbi:response regulator transcription factor [Streptomyces sp. CA-210063]|uniref:helix-turn-helix transcriptional regulator n=1 Tax=Streptomyces sp. CA-210063 TaxID=2801029 RepID=UPI00214AFAD0|nr:response regulator transcription factor [Streptomyces sp. CA-210063]UUU29342.1 response regulator transcription factor [Streptomyces sp. CA-210063]
MAQDLARFSAEMADELPPAAVLTRRLDWGDVCLAFKHGVTSYVLEGPHSCRLDEVLMCTARRFGILDPEIVGRVRIEARAKGRTATAKPGRSPSASEAAIPGSRPLLSQRESQVMNLLASGLDVRDVARQLFLTDKTVRNYLSRVYSKIGVRNQAQAVLYWLGRADSPTPGSPTRADGRESGPLNVG